MTGDRVRIRPGERIPVDGEVIDGHSAVDESLITGEPLPVDICAGSTVAGGGINGTGTLLVRVTAIGEDSFLQRVVKEVRSKCHKVPRAWRPPWQSYLGCR